MDREDDNPRLAEGGEFAQENHKFLYEVFDQDGLDLLFSVVFEDESVLAYDELLDSGVMNYEDLMKFVRLEPFYNNLFSNIRMAVDMLLDSLRQNQQTLVEFMGVKWLQAVSSAFENSLEHSAGGPLKEGRIKSFLFRYFQDYFISRCVERFGIRFGVPDGEEDGLIYSDGGSTVLPADENLEAALAEGGLLLFERDDEVVLYAEAKQQLLGLFGDEDVCAHLEGFQQQGADEAQKHLEELSDTRDVDFARLELGSLVIVVDRLKDEEVENAANAFVIASVNIRKEDDSGEWSFEVHRDGTITSIFGHYPLENLSGTVSKGNLDSLRELIYSSIIFHLETQPDLDYLDYPQVTKDKDGVVDRVEEVVDPEAKKEKDLPISLIYGITGVELVRKFRRLLGEEVRVKGSHYVFESRLPDKVVPVNRHHERIKIKTLKSILLGAGVSVRDVHEA